MLGNIFVFDDFELDIHKMVLRRADTPVRADALILRLLEALVRALTYAHPLLGYAGHRA
jgi:DNA-binding winged helix-turn-helix (wHTH) protein